MRTIHYSTKNEDGRFVVTKFYPTNTEVEKITSLLLSPKRSSQIDFRGNILKTANIEIFDEDQTPRQDLIESDNMASMSIARLKEIVGSFEQEWNDHIVRAPQFVHYEGTYIQGELDFMLERGAITIRRNPYPHIRIRAPAYQSFDAQKKAMNELRWRRQKAKKYELEELENTAPDEIDVKQMFD